MENTADDFLAHYGVKGMRWGRRKARNESDTGTSKALTKRVLTGTAVVAGTAAVAVGAYYVSKKLKSNPKVSDIPRFSSLTKQKTFTMEDALRTYRKVEASEPSYVSKTAKTATKGANAVKNIRMDKKVSDFLADSPNRILADQKQWSTGLGKSLDKIIREDAQFMNDYIANWTPKAIGR